MTFLDGCTLNGPAWALIPTPHESDKAFFQEEGSNWWPENQEVRDGKFKGLQSTILNDIMFEWDPKKKG